MTFSPKILVYGFGNPGRQDDGLGIRLVESLEEWAAKMRWENIQFDSNYQLNIEDADVIKDKDIVIFADATVDENVKDFLITKVEPSEKVEFTMHAVSPGFILYLCESMNKTKPETYLVHIRGYEWELKEGLTDKAYLNLYTARNYIEKMILDKFKQKKQL